VVLEIGSILTTCGFGVPLFDFRGQREQLTDFACKMGAEKMDEYRHRKNERSIDGLPTYLFGEPPG